MSVVTVTQTPQMIQAGGQGVVTLINEGPGTVYLNSDSSANSDNGFPLRPLATMTWQGGNQLWAVSRDEARLNMNISGDLSNPNRSNSQKLLFQDNKFDITKMIEVGSYESLLVRYLVKTDDTTDASICNISAVWSDDAGNLIYEENITTWATDGLASLDLPIRGAFCSLRYQSSTGACLSVKVYGSTRVVPLTASAYMPVLYSGLYAIDKNAGIFYDYAWGAICIPSWGTRVSITGNFGSVPTGGAELTISDAEHTNAYYARIPIGAGTDVNFNSTVIVPTSRPLVLKPSKLPSSVTGGHVLTIVWES